MKLLLFSRHEADVGEEALNEEELAVDSAIGDTFQKVFFYIDENFQVRSY